MVINWNFSQKKKFLVSSEGNRASRFINAVNERNPDSDTT
jgi:glutathione peroxidase-family protein